jgi:hypothetical protein
MALMVDNEPVGFTGNYGDTEGFEPRRLDQINLEEQLVAQYHRVLRLQEDVMYDDATPANQKAQVSGQVASTLQQLIRMQEDLQRSEAFKLMESVLADAIKTLPVEAKEAFFEEYERLAAKAGLL